MFLDLELNSPGNKTQQEDRGRVDSKGTRGQNVNDFRETPGGGGDLDALEE
jgi:hypothetical protein